MNNKAEKGRKERRNMAKRQKLQDIKIEAEDLDAILEVGANSLKIDRSVKFPDDAQGLEDFKQATIDFFDYVRATNSNPACEHKLIPDVELWASYLGTTRMTILRYEKNRGEEWQSFIEQVKGLITAAKKQLIYRQKIPAIVGIFDLCNNSGYSNTSEFKLSAQQFEPEKKALSSKELPKLFAEAEEISKTENIDKSQAVVKLLASGKRYDS